MQVHSQELRSSMVGMFYRSAKHATSLFMLLLFTLMISPYGHAQATATLEGLVKDSSDAVLPNAQVTATELSTGLARTVSSNTGGYYRIASLPVGDYDITVSQSGFKKILLSKVTLNVGQLRACRYYHAGWRGEPGDHCSR